MSRPARGQALVEFMIGSIAAVTILISGLYLSELGFIRLKLHEAAAFAAYDATGRSVYELDRNGTTSLLGDVSGNSINDPAGMAKQRYKNLDGRGSGGSPTVTQVATKLTGLQVACNRISRLDMPTARKPVWVAAGSENPFYVQVVNFNHAAYPNNLEVTPVAFDPWGDRLRTDGNLAQHYDDLISEIDTLLPGEGGMGCFAEATVAAPIASMINGAGGLLGVPLIKHASMTICAPGNCSGRYAMLVGDYALSSMSSDPNVNEDCRLLGGCDNNRYRQIVEGIYESNVWKTPLTYDGFAEMYATWMKGNDPTSGYSHKASHFWMSFSGEEHGYMDGYASGQNNLRHNTSGVNTRGRDTPTNWNGCWMGMGASNAWDTTEKYMQRCF